MKDKIEDHTCWRAVNQQDVVLHARNAKYPFGYDSSMTNLDAMRKSELVQFTWLLVKCYNRVVRQLEMVREQAGNIRTGIGEQY